MEAARILFEIVEAILEVTHMKSGHEVMLTKPKEVAGVILQASRAVTTIQ
jgi:hypothetical protein